MEHKKESGFTLIELLIAVVIIGVLTAVALPAYQDFVKTSRRADARNALFDLQVKQERYRSNNLSYGTLGELGVSSASEAGHYSIAVTASTATTYTATATPAGSQVGDDCGIFAITNSSPDTSTGYADSDCWR